MDLDFTLGVYAEPVRHGRHGSEGPAGPAASLVSDLLQGGTVRPLGPGVETGGDVLRVSQYLSLRQTVVVQLSVRVDSASDSTEVVVAGARVETGGKIFVFYIDRPQSYFLPDVQVELARLSLSMKWSERT